MSLTSYRTAPPRDSGGVNLRVDPAGRKTFSFRKCFPPTLNATVFGTGARKHGGRVDDVGSDCGSLCSPEQAGRLFYFGDPADDVISDCGSLWSWEQAGRLFYFGGARLD